MHTRFLTVLAVSAFVLTLLFAVAAGAQEESTDAAATLGGGGGIQVQQVQQQQVGTQQVTVQAEGCKDPNRVRTFTGDENQRTPFFDIDGDNFRIEYETTPTDDQDLARVEVRVLDDDNRDTDEGFVALDGDDGDENILEGPGEFRLEIEARDASYRLVVFDCEGNDSANNNGGGGGNNNNGGSGDGTTDTTGVTPAQADTTGTTDTTGTADPVASDAATADATLEDGGDSANRDGSFRCDSFLHVVRDDDGALRRQYRDGIGDDELVVQRFERCLEADVLANTIPNKLLPDTGGPSLPVGGGALLLVAGAALALRMIRR